jgi:ubiquinone/menaquinone biosynthesis C-methylase UbiE
MRKIRKSQEAKKSDMLTYDSAISGDFYHSSEANRAMTGIEKKWLAKWMNPGEPSGQERRALEIGCGGGFQMEWLARYADLTVGVDHSSKSIREAARKFEGNGKFAVLQADAEELPFRDSSVDFIYCGSILHHLPEYGKSLSKMYRSLKDGGIVIASEPCAYNPFAVIRRKFFPSIYHTADERPFPPHEIIAEFKKRFDEWHYKRFFVFSINSSLVERLLGEKTAMAFLRLSTTIDSVMVRIPLVKELCWRIDLVGIKRSTL